MLAVTSNCDRVKFLRHEILTRQNTIIIIRLLLGTAVAQWLRCCATNRKVAGSIPAGVTGFFIALWPWGRLSL